MGPCFRRPYKVQCGGNGGYAFTTTSRVCRGVVRQWGWTIQVTKEPTGENKCTNIAIENTILGQLLN